MTSPRVPITPGGHKKLQLELKRLKTVERPKIIELIAYARSLGDLSENAEYDTAKDRQSFMEGRINELESKLSRADIIDPTKITNKERVIFGLTVTLEDAESGDTVKYQLVGPDESAPEDGMISITSPIGKALVGKHLDDEVMVRTPGGMREFVVLDIT